MTNNLAGTLYSHLLTSGFFDKQKGIFYQRQNDLDDIYEIIGVENADIDLFGFKLRCRAYHNDGSLKRGIIYLNLNDHLKDIIVPDFKPFIPSDTDLK